MEWQTIDTAPQTGSFLAWNRMMGIYMTRRVVTLAGDEFPMCGIHDNDRTVPGIWFPQPTYWMPLPEPPE